MEENVIRGKYFFYRLSMPFFQLEVFALQKLHHCLETAASMPQDNWGFYDY